jgi:hypothetical protein
VDKNYNVISNNDPLFVSGSKLFYTENAMRDYFDQEIFDYIKKRMGIEHIIHIDQDDDLAQLFWMASNADHDAFVDQLHWISCGTKENPKAAAFIFPATVTSKERQMIHRLGRAGRMESKTLFGKLHVFIKKF